MEKGIYPNRLYILRKARCMQQDEVCNALGILKRSLYNYEHCLTPVPSNKLIEFAKLYKCSIDHILYMEPVTQQANKMPSTAQIEELTGKFCDKYCKFASSAANQKQLDDICSKCPMNELFEVFYSSNNSSGGEDKAELDSSLRSE